MRLSRRALPALAATAGGALLWNACDNSAAMNESTPNVRHIVENDFTNEVTRCPLPVVVDFYATWCVPCREVGPLLDRVAAGYAGRVKFVKVNVDESTGLALAWQVEELPQVLIFKGGKPVEHLLGIPAAGDLTNKLDALLSAK